MNTNKVAIILFVLTENLPVSMLSSIDVLCGIDWKTLHSIFGRYRLILQKKKETDSNHLAVLSLKYVIHFPWVFCENWLQSPSNRTYLIQKLLIHYFLALSWAIKSVNLIGSKYIFVYHKQWFRVLGTSTFVFSLQPICNSLTKPKDKNGILFSFEKL